MTGMPCQHRTAPRLADIPDVEPAPPRLLRRDARQFLNQINSFRVSPIAIAAQAHGLPGGSTLGQGDAARQTRPLVAKIAALRAEKLFGMNTLHRGGDTLTGQDTACLRLRFGLHTARKP